MPDIYEKPFTLITPAGVPLRGDIRWDNELVKNGENRLPVAAVCHGFKAFKDWGPFPSIGRTLAEGGFVSIVFNFSHNGIGQEPRKFVEHDKFADNTISLEIQDLRTVIDEICSGSFGLPFIDRQRIGVIGHSRGGGVSIIAGREDARIGAVVAWSTIARFNRYTEEQKERWRAKGYVQLHSVSDHNLFRISTALLDDLEQNSARLNIVNAVAALNKPLLIVHGTADIPAKITEAEELFAAADRTLTEFVRLEGAGHMYGAKHPYKEPSPTLEHVLELTLHWLHTHLSTEASWK
ncbi:MAG: prolyl oligopeptidase family serine peptidase [Bacteroidetes bacterium]|nr:prolyl oligopeptidase family serine peptidase [Bacteroidota bacterium]